MIITWYILIFIIILAILYYLYNDCQSPVVKENFDEIVQQDGYETIMNKDEIFYERAYEDQQNQYGQVEADLLFKQVPPPPAPAAPVTKKPPTPTPTHAPVDCSYSKWSHWSPCSTKCGIGKQTRWRAILTPEKYGGKCDRTDGALKQSQTCHNTIDCIGITNDIPDDIVDGLFFMIYSGYHDEDPTYTASSTYKLLNYAKDNTDYLGITNEFLDISSATNGLTMPNSVDTDFSVVWTGYLYTRNEIGEWKFWINNNDGAYLWIGDEANQNPIVETAVIQNGGIKSNMEEQMCVLNLQDKTYYPIRILFGQYADAYNFSLRFQRPKSPNSQTNGTGYFFTKRPDAVDCTYSPYSGWSKCTADCSGGTMFRTRTVLFGAAYGGACDVSAGLKDVTQCNTKPCAVDASYTWPLDWSPCQNDVFSDDYATQYMDMIIVNNAMNGGVSYPTPTRKVRNCPIDCVYNWDDVPRYCNVDTGYILNSYSVIDPCHNGLACTKPPTTNCLAIFLNPMNWNVSVIDNNLTQFVCDRRTQTMCNSTSVINVIYGNRNNNLYCFDLSGQPDYNYFGIEINNNGSMLDDFSNPTATLSNTITLNPHATTAEKNNDPSSMKPLKTKDGKNFIPAQYKLVYYIQSCPPNKAPCNIGYTQSIVVTARVNNADNSHTSFAFSGIAVPGLWIKQVLTFTAPNYGDTKVSFDFTFLNDPNNPNHSDACVAISGVHLERCKDVNGDGTFCTVNCEYGLTDFMNVDASYCQSCGFTKRDIQVFVKPQNKGQACPVPQYTCDQTNQVGTCLDTDILCQKIPVDCSYTWNDWKPYPWTSFYDEVTDLYGLCQDKTSMDDYNKCMLDASNTRAPLKRVLVGTKYRELQTIYTPKNNGKSCPITPETILIPTDCMQYNTNQYFDNNQPNGTTTRYILDNNGKYIKIKDMIWDSKINDYKTIKTYDTSKVLPLSIAQCYISKDCSNVQWSSWSDCSSITGLQYRNPNIYSPALNGGTCPDKNSKDGNTPCRVGCIYGEWTKWSDCVAGSASRTRTRTVRQPLNDGSKCIVDGTDEKEIDNNFCPVDCQTDGWQDWGPCDTSTGTKQRLPKISVQPRNNGKACDMTPQKDDCMVDCVWEWGPWETCNPSTGQELRHAIIYVQGRHGGQACPYNDQTRVCNIDCVIGDNKGSTMCGNDHYLYYKTAILKQASGDGKPCDVSKVGQQGNIVKDANGNPKPCNIDPICNKQDAGNCHITGTPQFCWDAHQDADWVQQNDSFDANGNQTGWKGAKNKEPKSACNKNGEDGGGSSCSKC
mgnify:CR=1 FL=1